MSVENVRLSRAARVRIERDREKTGARVLVDGVDVSSHVTAVSWSMRAGQLPTATITFHDVEVAVDAEGPDVEKLRPEQWCERYGVDIRDPDGWRGAADPGWHEPLTLADFYARARRSTIRGVASVDWDRIRRDSASPSLNELSVRLREHGLTEAADFFASVKSVEARERITSRDELNKDG